ncbi:hypothetical protein GY45DRAFT_1330391 [Cubamyces sp. BRFM 1775]|nr:hypothetical protein GY45DRAFT_1330391 [Cubamyces sp. BRFM 1775]
MSTSELQRTFPHTLAQEAVTAASYANSSSEDPVSREEGRHVCCDAEPILLGYSFGRRTAIYRARREGRTPVIIKEYFLDSSRHCEENDLTSNLQAENASPGQVRAVTTEAAVKDGFAIIVRNKSSSDTLFKRRIVSAVPGVCWEYAKSVNDLLKVAYDALETHRAAARHRRVLHLDISICSILMYPPTYEFDKGSRCDFLPPLIEEVLAGGRLEDDKRRPCGLIIDFDHSVKLSVAEHSTVQALEKLQFSNGTPMYMARAIIVSADIPSSIYSSYFKRMPTLSAKATDLYIKAHGQGRHSRYRDNPDGNTYHGGIPPLSNDPEDLFELAYKTPFYHRLQYDAESVFWRLYSVLLRVKPVGSVETARTALALQQDWKDMRSHTIPEVDGHIGYRDVRVRLFDNGKDDFKTAFLPIMQDVADMLFEMARQMLSSYALMARPPPHEDHLHEALQRLILDYLVTHESDPIPLTPGVLRTDRTATAAGTIEKDDPDLSDGKHNTGTQSSTRKRNRDEIQGTQRQCARKLGGMTLARHRDDHR